MPHKYDINTDHLKCNFCTQWFTCSQHYANIQRYSLKACTHCIQHFQYSVMHPQTYKLYKVLLFDTNIRIQQPENTQHHQHHQILTQLQFVEQEIKDALSRHFQMKIKEVMLDLQQSTQKLQKCTNKVRNQMISQQKGYNPIKNSQMFAKINQIKEKPIEYWLNHKEQMPPFAPKLPKTKSTHQLSRKSSHSNLEKQNINVHNSHKKPGWGKTIRYKIGMKPSEQKSMKSSVCLQYSTPRQPLAEQSSSLANSIHKYSKKLSMSTLIPISQHIGSERDLNQVTKLLDSARKHNTYLPITVQPQNSTLIKNESKRTHADSIIDIRQKTSKGGQLLQLIGSDVSKINFECFLQSLGNQSQTKIVRVIKAGMTDYEFDSLLRFISKHNGIQTVIVTNNKLTELSLAALQTFRMLHKDSCLCHVYLGSNRISKQHAVPLVHALNELKLQIFL